MLTSKEYALMLMHAIFPLCFYIKKKTIKKLTSFYLVTLIFGDNFFLLILVNCVRDESCRETPLVLNGSISQDAAVNLAHRCTLSDF